MSLKELAPAQARPNEVWDQGTSFDLDAGRRGGHGGSRPAPGRNFGVLSTYPPTVCGLATFSAALARGLEANGASARVVRLGDGMTASDPLVVAEMTSGVPGSLEHGIATLNKCDVAVVQHEYGVYGGTDGDQVLDVLAGLDVPSIVVAHTVLLEPTGHQRAVLEAVVDFASALVVMGRTARDRLCRGFDLDPAKVVIIPHGATLPTQPRSPRFGAPLLLTWGLLGLGKGIEWVIDAMADLGDLGPHYVVAGRTHPKVMAAGEAYRDMLVARAERRGVASSVTFDPAYRDLPSLTQLVQSASVVVLPYDSRDQVTSGVLIDALAAGRPVVATAFPHAVEMLSSGAGIVVPQGDAPALAAALRRVLSEPGLAVSMEAEAARLAPTLSWPAVSNQYIELGERLLVGSDLALM